MKRPRIKSLIRDLHKSQIFVLKQYLVLTLHCLHATAHTHRTHSPSIHTNTHTHTDTHTDSHTHTHHMRRTNNKQQPFHRIACLFVCLTVCPSVRALFCLSIAGCRLSTVDILCLFAAGQTDILTDRRNRQQTVGIMKNISFINKTNKTKHTPRAAPKIHDVQC